MAELNVSICTNMIREVTDMRDKTAMRVMSIKLDQISPRFE